MNQLRCLDEKFDFANSAPAALHIEAGAGFEGSLVALPDPQGERADFLDRAKIEH